MRQQVETDARVLASTEKDIRELEAKRDELDVILCKCMLFIFL